MVNWSVWIVIKKRDNPLSFDFATMFILKNHEPCADKFSTILLSFGISLVNSVQLSVVLRCVTAWSSFVILRVEKFVSLQI